MARLTNVSGAALMLFARPGSAEAHHVEPEGIAEVPGDINVEKSAGDAWIIDGRAWPKALWSNADEPAKTEDKAAPNPPARPATKAADTTSTTDTPAADTGAKEE